MKPLPLLILLSIVFLACKKEQTTSNPSTSTVLQDSLSQALTEIHGQGGIKGFGIAIVNADTTLYVNGFGYASLDSTKAYTKHSIQNIASVSKTLIGISVLKAQEMGKLKLDDPINAYLPFKVNNPFHPEDTITIKQLATHTSSIQDGDLYDAKSYILKNAADTSIVQSMPRVAYFNPPAANMVMGTYLENFLSQEGNWFQEDNFLKHKPGQFYEYTNVGATLAAYIIERATGKPYKDFTQEYILNPLGMNASGWDTEKLDTTQLTRLFTVEGEHIPDYSLITYPDGGLITSAHDKAKYLSEIIKGYAGKGKLLSKESYALFFAKFLSASNFEEERDTDRPFDDEYNSGLFMGHAPNGYIGHTGGDPGVSTFMFFNPETKIGKLLFINTDLNAETVDQFFAIWDTLASYEQSLNDEVGKTTSNE
ncbi:MAG: serine hydrolase domain-containing protein [Bacteroidota bacterium]